MINCLFCINCSDELKDKVRNSVHGVNIDFKSKNDISDLNGYEVVVGNVNKDLLVNSDIKWLQLESAGCEKYISLLDKMDFNLPLAESGFPRVMPSKAACKSFSKGSGLRSKGLPSTSTASK